MSKKFNLETLIHILSRIQSNEKWSIDTLNEQLGITEKELFYLLSIITDIYSQHGELLIDFEYDELKREFLFNLNSSIKNVTQINDGQLFNLYFLLSTNSIYKQLITENKDIKQFYDVLGPFSSYKFDKINIDKLMDMHYGKFNGFQNLLHFEMDHYILDSYNFKRHECDVIKNNNMDGKNIWLNLYNNLTRQF